MTQKFLKSGGGHGALSLEYKNLHPETEWTIVEPAPSPLKNVTARFIKKFVDENFKPDQEYKVIVHSHTLEHIYEPVKFMRNISNFMPVGSCQIFSVPDIKAWIEKNHANALDFEHTFLLCREYIEYILKGLGWELIEEKNFGDQHSIFMAWRKYENKNKFIPNFTGLYECHKNIFMKYCDNMDNKVLELNKKIAECNRPIYIFGAQIFTQHLLNLGLKEDAIISILDNNPLKQQKRLYGSKLYVQSPKILSNVEHPVVILNVGPFRQEITEDIINNINPDTEFWE